MTNPDPLAEIPASQIPAPIDPAVAAEAILAEAAYLRMQATLMIAPKEPDLTRLDLSPLGRLEGWPTCRAAPLRYPVPAITSCQSPSCWSSSVAR